MQYALPSIIKAIQKAIAKSLDVENEIVAIKDAPEKSGADLAVPCFGIAKKLNKNPRDVAQSLVNRIEPDIKEWAESLRAVNGYLNIKLNQLVFAKKVVGEASSANYGKLSVGTG